MVDFTLPGWGFASIFSPPKPSPPPPAPLPIIDKRQKQVEEEGVLLAEKRKKQLARSSPAAGTLIDEIGNGDKLGA